jgi:hypothetical protein
MKVFIGWSGEKSKKAADLFIEWISIILPAVEPWISDIGIRKGHDFEKEIDKSLHKAKIGIFFLSLNNLDSKRLYFEAGAVYKGLDKNLIFPLLIDLEYGDVKEPLKRFQLTKINKKNDMINLCKDINSTLKKRKITEGQLEKSFKKLWPDFKTKIESLSERVFIVFPKRTLDSAQKKNFEGKEQ